MHFDYWPHLIAFLFLTLLCGPPLIATAHVMLFSKGTATKKMRLASRFLIGFNAETEAWRYLIRGGRFD